MGAIGTVSLRGPPAPDGQRLKKRYGYLAWLCLGSHYLYLGRPIRQLLFWLTLGGLLLWWLTDLFRLPEMIAEHNRRATEALVARYEESLARRLMHLEALNLAASSTAPLPAQAAKPAFYHPAPGYDETGSGRRGGSTVSTLFLAGAIGVVAALYVFNPPPLFPHADASFRAVRQVNVRDLPSTASPIRAVAAKETVLSGTVVKASNGTEGWLKIGRGSHSGGYVAVQNLKSL